MRRVLQVEFLGIMIFKKREKEEKIVSYFENEWLERKWENCKVLFWEDKGIQYLEEESVDNRVNFC